MKINIDAKKVMETGASILQKTTDISKKTAGVLKEGAKFCSIEISESNVEVTVDKRKFEINESINKTVVSSDESAERSLSYKG